MTNKKNFSALSKIDLYADVVSLTLNGKKFHGTRLGGCLTIMLYLTVFAYFAWGTLKCLSYHDPQVFTANVPNQPTNTTENYQMVAGVGLESKEADAKEIFQYLSIVFYDTSNDKWYNAYVKESDKNFKNKTIQLYVPRFDFYTMNFVALVGYCA